MQAASGAQITGKPQSLAKIRWTMAGIIALGYLADQLSKIWAEHALGDGHHIELIGQLLSFRLFYNPGAAFSMGTQFTIGLTCLALVVLIGLLVLGFPRVRDWAGAVALALLAFGVAGNLTDRLLRAPGAFRGHVVDFIALKGFAVFNVADIGITCAAVLLIIRTLCSESKARKLADPEEYVEAAEPAADERDAK